MSMRTKCAICRNPISENRVRCQECKDLIPTHIMIRYDEHDSNLLFRASDGIGIAHQSKVVVVIGEDKNRNVSRCFMDEKHAESYLYKVLPWLDLAGMPTKPEEASDTCALVGKAQVICMERHVYPIIETRDGAKGLILPANAAELPTQFKKFASN